ncbi:type II secretion system minor pseudopilin GspK [Pseudomarimonas arenosa]|uniref:Type II secretion system protein K n=1 Tax=Pseudomarimonas arenosa TaxID=2774145 RepID=A0AAW3ZKH9_9GAMM|nr:type II secretion system minor pseudopilin GspK [Pseudomarimonas arenosa]
MSCRHRRQRGVALLAALLVVALATVLIAAMLDRGEQSRARSRNSLRAEQTWQLALGAEYWALTQLDKDWNSAGGSDHYGEAWSLAIPPLPVPGGQLSGQVFDQTGCIDLNRLFADGQPVGIQVRRFKRLLQVLKLNENLADRVIDWIDPDNAPRPQGAEDLAYLAQTPAYRSANRPMAHISELRLVAGVDAKTYQTLRPHVCALPEAVDLNLNFASLAVWMSLDERITESLARQLWQDGKASYDSWPAVEQALLRLQLPAVAGEGLGTTSGFVLLRAEVDVDGLPFQYSALIRREQRGSQTWARLRGAW